jgi:hypothetical protein
MSVSNDVAEPGTAYTIVRRYYFRQFASAELEGRRHKHF